MKKSAKLLVATAAIASVGLIGAYAIAQHGPGFGHGPMGMGHGMGHGAGPGMGRGMMGMGAGTATQTEQQELHDMFMNHDRIRRTVTELPNGIRTVTESDDPELAKKLVAHVAGMMKRVEEGRDPRLPMQSPMLEVIFRNRDKIKTATEPTPKGIAVTQTSDDTETVVALKKHAADVSDLVTRGMEAAHETMMKNMGMQMRGHDRR